ncbi:MAG: DDE-type integrase/transposase/recombinase [Nitrospirales bacterium]
MDRESRRVLAWRLSNTLTSHCCVEALEVALATHGPPEIFNRDQGALFTSQTFTKFLSEAGVFMSMDGKARWVVTVFVEYFGRSVQYEEVYLKVYDAPH